MKGIDHLLGIARSAIMASQTAIQVTGHNIANVNTDGFSRQRPVLEAVEPSKSDNINLGEGVAVKDILRTYDQFLAFQMVSTEENLGKWKARNEGLKKIESTFNEMTGNGLSQIMSDFWVAWNEVANHPEGYAERQGLISKGQILVSRLNSISDDLKNAQKAINLRISYLVKDINLLTKGIAEINKKIGSIEITGKNANDLRDKRDIMVQELSSKVGINTLEDREGMINIYLPFTGSLLVEGQNSFNISIEGNSEGLSDVIWNDGGGITLNITRSLRGGEIGGLIELRDEDLPYYMDKINDLANAIIFEVNKIHSNGAGLKGFTSLTSTYPTSGALSSLPFGNKIDYQGSFKLWIYSENGDVESQFTIDISKLTGASTLEELAECINDQVGVEISTVTKNLLKLELGNGRTFSFSDDTSNILSALGLNTFFTGKDASDIGINSILVSDPNLISAGKVNSSTGEISTGDNRNARIIVDLQNQEKMDNNSATFLEFYNSIIGSIGIAIDEGNKNLSIQEDIMENLKNQRESISGVSLDEEMTNLLKFQRAYSAAAYLVKTTQQMMDDLLNMIYR
jgi:flagellar hook-associated protein 1 FlgK